MARVTQKEIAKALKVHVSTVSKALKGDPAVADATVARVRQAAKDMGFVPDPLLTALSAYRKKQKPEVYRATIAWVYNHSQEETMSAFAGYAEYYEGARLRAGELGFKLSPFWIERGSSPGALDRVLQARGIRGLIAAPQAMPGLPLRLAWARYAAVTIGYTLKAPELDRVTNDHFATMTDLLEILHKRGYRRVGCYIWDVDNERMARRARSAFLSVSREYRSSVASYSSYDPNEFLNWVQRHKLDAVVCRGREQYDTLVRAGVSVPESLGVAAYALDPHERIVSGMHHNNHRIGAACVDWVSGKLQREQFEPSNCSQRLLIASSWVENGSLITDKN